MIYRYRAANAIVALSKKGAKHSEATVEVPSATGTNGVSSKTDVVETEVHEDTEAVTENSTIKEEEVASSSGNFYFIFSTKLSFVRKKSFFRKFCS